MRLAHLFIGHFLSFHRAFHDKFARLDVKLVPWGSQINSLLFRLLKVILYRLLLLTRAWRSFQTAFLRRGILPVTVSLTLVTFPRCCRRWVSHSCTHVTQQSGDILGCSSRLDYYISGWGPVPTGTFEGTLDYPTSLWWNTFHPADIDFLDDCWWFLSISECVVEKIAGVYQSFNFIHY